MSINKKPLLIVVAGPNGAGKTTFIERVNPQILQDTIFINTDIIAKNLQNQFPDKKSEHLNIMAGREAVLLYEKHILEKKSFSLETTLAGNSPISFLKKAKANGFETLLFYIGIASPLDSRLRVDERVRKGGHNIPDEDIFRRYDRSMNNLQKAVEYSDRVVVFDNSPEKKHTLLFELENGIVKSIENIKMPNWAKNIINCDALKIGEEIDFHKQIKQTESKDPIL